MTSFLVDQQLPMALATYLAERGHDAHPVKEYEGGTTMPDPGDRGWRTPTTGS